MELAGWDPKAKLPASLRRKYGAIAMLYIVRDYVPPPNLNNVEFETKPHFADVLPIQRCLQTLNSFYICR